MTHDEIRQGIIADDEKYISAGNIGFEISGSETEETIFKSIAYLIDGVVLSARDEMQKQGAGIYVYKVLVTKYAGKEL